MNQILSTTNTSNGKKNRGPAEISTVVKFFVISLIIFGIFMIGTGSYAIYKNMDEKNNIPTKPTITQEQKDEKTVVLKVTHDKAIAQIEYSWNEDEPETITGNGRKYIEQEITIPGGTNTLHVKATDVNGQEISTNQTYETEDIIKMEIQNGKVKVTAELENEISYMTYRWDEEEEQRQDINSTTLDYDIDIPMGEHTLTVVLVDVNNETTTKEQKIKGVTKPTISVTQDTENPNAVLISVTDANGIESVDVTVNGNSQTVQAEGKTEFNVKLEMPVGENNLEIIAHNVDGVDSDPYTVRAVR